MDLAHKFGQLIETGTARQIRLDNGITQQAMADRLGISPSAITRWEAGNRVPNPQVMARYLDIIDALTAADVSGESLGEIQDQGADAEAATRDALTRAAEAAAVIIAETTAASVSPNDLSGINTTWREQLEAELLPLMTQQLVTTSQEQAAALSEALGIAVAPLTSQDERVTTYLAEARNRLSGIGDELWMHARESLIQGVQAGEAIPALAARVRDAVSVTMPRAAVIARTEVVSASNAGSIETVRAAGLSGSKTWLATADSRTRPEHSAASGQTVPLDQPFSVGGESLDHPGDPTASAANVVSCRCTMTYDVTPAELAASAGDTSTLANDTQDGTAQTRQFQGVAIVEDTWTGDGRRFAAGSLDWPDLATTVVPLQWQKETTHGGDHDVTVSVGRLTTLERDNSGKIAVSGTIDTESEDGAEVVRRMEAGTLSGVSIVADDPDNGDMEFVWGEGCEDGAVSFECLSPEGVIFHTGRIRAVTLVDVPAFVEASIELVDEPEQEEPEDAPTLLAAAADDPLEATSVVDQLEAMVAAARTINIPDVPPDAWFSEPTVLPEVGGIQVTDEGRIYGLVAPRGVQHRAFRERVTVPTGNVDYGLWMNRQTLTEEGRVSAGPITMQCGHAMATPNVDGPAAQDHYDNSCSVVATARVGENEHGVWIAGALLPDVTAAQITRILACQLSGDWRPHREKPGKREFAGALLVPVPGFPVAASSPSMRVESGELVASAAPVQWVAAGAIPDPPATDVVDSSTNPAAEDVPSYEDIKQRKQEREAAAARKARLAELAAEVIGEN